MGLSVAPRQGNLFTLTSAGRAHQYSIRGRLSGGLSVCPALKASEVIVGLCRFRGGGEDGLLVCLEDLKPVVDVGRMVLPGRDADAQIGAEECGP